MVMLFTIAGSVFAGDPPDTQVSVGVVTPGDVDLNVNIDAGGNVNAIVDGVDLHQTAAMASDAYIRGQQNTDWLGTWVYYWKLSGMGNMVNSRLSQLEGFANLLTNASAKLIQGQELTSQEVSDINTQVGSLQTSTDASLADINTALVNLKAQDDKTWNQLMYGAETHIAMLDTRLVEQEQVIVNLQTETDLLKAQLDVANTNYTNLRNYTDYLQRQYLYYFWIMGIAIVAMLVLVIALRKRRV
jgi:hypothetical protein